MRENFAQKGMEENLICYFAAFYAKNSVGIAGAKEILQNVLTVTASKVD